MYDLNTLQSAAGWAIAILGSLLIMILLGVTSSQKGYHCGTSRKDAPIPAGSAPEDDDHGNKHYTEMPIRYCREFDKYPKNLDGFMALPPIGSVAEYRIGQNFEDVAEFLRAYPVGVVKVLPEYAVPSQAMSGVHQLASSVDAIRTVACRKILKVTLVRDTVQFNGLRSIQLENGQTFWVAEFKVISRITTVIDTVGKRC